MPLRDRLLALLVAACWGVNVPATALGSQHFPPPFMVAVRFTLLAVPTMLYVPWPRVPLRWFLGLGIGRGTGTVRFALLYVAMAIGMPSGLASLVLPHRSPATAGGRGGCRRRRARDGSGAIFTRVKRDRPLMGAWTWAR